MYSELMGQRPVKGKAWPLFPKMHQLYFKTELSFCQGISTAKGGESRGD
jgi:hypothetical protein